MVVGFFALASPRAFEATAGRNVGLHTDDRFYARLPRRLVEGPGAEHAPVIRERQARHLEVSGPFHQVCDAIGPVQQGILGVAVQVDEAHEVSSDPGLTEG